MSPPFVRTGPLTEAASYPDWAQQLLLDCHAAKRRVTGHELYLRMRDAELGPMAMQLFLVGAWPVVEQFPQYMAQNLLKVRYGRQRGEDMARRFLIHNIRVAQSHAEHWIAWAEACGIGRAELHAQRVPSEMHALSHWCWHICAHDPLWLAMAATNYAIEDATGDWAALVCSSGAYEASFAPGARRRATRWLTLHAHDDAPPWEALEIVCTLIGTHADPSTVAALRDAICKSYDYMRLILDRCLQAEVSRPPASPRKAFVQLG
ncbi:pyrroloquinoline quinone (PQQ) biosynthesis protein C [Crenobacter luteus]|uniref:TenA family transcriptional regulator n=1 Tax=Crenobacter luteus TaxID=1452487 RepID=UPI00105337BD|nr:TenA family transcriptional regulator [Crenobacter luteus]TCP11574.1 pyrroloquinoline quinone (PQQ) biosynthesis protein C [Crenobacter luteus]